MTVIENKVDYFFKKTLFVLLLETPNLVCLSLRKKCPYSELFWSPFFLHFPAFELNTEHSIFSPNAGKCGKNGDQNNSEYGHFLRSETSALNLSIGIWKGILYVTSHLPEDLEPSNLTWWQLRVRVPDSPSHVIFLPCDNVINEKNYMCNCTTPIAIKFGRVVT